MTDRVSYKQVLDAFYTMEEISWPRLTDLFTNVESSILAKRKLAEILKDLLKFEMIVKIPGLPMKWKITESGKIKIKQLLKK